MTMEDDIAEFGFDCKVRKLSARTIANYQKQMKYLQRYLKDEFEVTTVEDVKSYHLKQFLAMIDDRGRKRCNAFYRCCPKSISLLPTKIKPKNFNVIKYTAHRIAP